MGKLNLNKEKISEARSYAFKIAADTQEFIDKHTTVTVERTVCRLLGIDGVDDFGVPYPNVLVDQVNKEGKLGHGVSNYIASALKNTGLSLTEIPQLVSEGKLSITDFPLLSKKEVDEILDKYIDESLFRIKQNRSKEKVILISMVQKKDHYFMLLLLLETYMRMLFRRKLQLLQVLM